MQKETATDCRHSGQPVVVSFGDHAVSSLANSSGKTSFGQTMKNLFAFNIKVSFLFPVSGQFLPFWFICRHMVVRPMPSCFAAAV